MAAEHARVPASPGRGTIRRSSGSSAASLGDDGAADSTPAVRARAGGDALRKTDRMKIAAVQMVSTPSVERNLESARRLIGQRRRRRARRWSSLPEYFCLMGQSDRDKLGVAETPGDGPIQRMLAEAAREHGVWLIGGTLPLAVEAERRTPCDRPCHQREPRLLAARRAAPRATTRCICSRTTTAASATTRRARSRPAALRSRSTPTALRVGLSVCYDLRFPELYRALTRPPCDLLSVPVGVHATRPARRTGKCCCARARSRTSATSSPPRKAARTRTAGAPSATAWSSIRGARSSPAAATRARASSSPSSAASGSPTCAASCPRSSTGSTSDGARGRGGDRVRARRGASARTPRARRHRLRRRGSTSCRGPAAVVDFGSDGRIGAKWNAATKTIAFGRPQKDGHYHAFVADGDGGNERRVAFAAWRDDRHQFPAAWHPAGELLAMLVEQNEHERSSVDAIPGYGAYTDYWIVSRDGSRRGRSTRFPTATTTRSRTPRSRPTAASSPGPSASRRRASGTSTCSPAATSSRSPTSSFARSRTSRTFAPSSPAMSTRAARSNRSPPTTRRSRSTAPSSRRTCSRRASTRWTSRAARSRS